MTVHHAMCAATVRHREAHVSQVVEIPLSIDQRETAHIDLEVNGRREEGGGTHVYRPPGLRIIDHGIRRFPYGMSGMACGSSSVLRAL